MKSRTLAMTSILKRGLCFAAISLLAAASGAEFKFPAHTFTLPEGFEMELVAGPPLVERPVSMDFDEQGRLYVTISSGSNDKVEQQLEQKPHSVVRLEDTDGDGRFDRKTIFADNLMLPQGAMWFDGSLYVSAPPSIWKLTDTDGDGIADRREEWFQGKTLTGCANDLHGPHLGHDGWIYWTKGAAAEQHYTRANGKPFTTRAAHIFRARPDGSGIEPVLTGGMDNPVALEFTPGGERLLVGTFFVRPEAGKRDGIIHAIYGGVYGKPTAALDAHPKTGDLMPTMTHLGPSASCSIIQYRSRALGDEFHKNLFVCNFNLYNVTRHVLEHDGATFRTRDEVFLSSNNPDFHPTCILEDADGSLLLIDTGGWYKLCCPTSQLHKPDVLGAIYRIRHTGAPVASDPRGLRIAWQELEAKQLAALLGDERLFVRRRAIHEIAKKGNSAVPILLSSVARAPAMAAPGARRDESAIEARRNAVWALTRINTPTARDAVRLALSDRNSTVRLAAIHSVSAWRDDKAVASLLEVLNSGAPNLQRAAAEALGRIGEAKAIPTLLDASAKQHDRVLEHSLIYALIEIGNPELTSRGLQHDSPHARKAALVALDQMENGGLTAELVAPLLASKEPVVRSAAAWIATRHEEWGGALAGFLRQRLFDAKLDDAEAEELKSQLAQFARDAAVQELIAEALRETATDQARIIALRTMAMARLKETPATWAAELARILGGSDRRLAREAVATARAIAPPKQHAASLAAALSKLASDDSETVEARLHALAALPRAVALEPRIFEFLVAEIAAEKPVNTRSTAAAILAGTKLNEEQLLALADALKHAGPMELDKLLAAFEKSPSEGLGLKLIAALKEAKAFSSLRPEKLKPLFAKYPASIQSEADPLIAALDVDAEAQARHIDALLASLKEGDVRRGQAVFNSPQAACSACHMIGYAGGRLGPDLTRIGQIRSERDLLEALVYPSASFVRSYEPVVVLTHSGDDFSGVLKKDGDDEIILATGPTTEIVLARKEIAEIQPGTLSTMPGGLDEQLTPQELADLIAFLKAPKR